MLRVRFSPPNVGESDLSWAEFDWMARVVDRVEPFVALPRVHQLAITIELLPGAPCQVRLAVAENPPQHESRMTSVERNSELRTLIKQLLEIAVKSNDLVEKDFAVPVARGTKAMSPPRPKKPRRET